MGVFVDDDVEYRARSVEYTTILGEYRALFTPVAVTWKFVLRTM